MFGAQKGVHDSMFWNENIKLVGHVQWTVLLVLDQGIAGRK